MTLRESAWDELPIGVFVLDADGRVIDYNPRFMEFLHSTPERLVGFDVRTLRDKRFLPAIEKALAGQPSMYEGPYDATTGDAHVMLSMHCRPRFRDDGTPDGIVATFDDATERFRVERALRDQLALIEQQETTIRQLSAPILPVWDRVLCMPVIGLVDDVRAAEMTEALLQAITRELASFAIIDLTGVETVDTSTAQHLIRFFRAVSLVGAEPILCGMRAPVAQTVISLGVDMTRLRIMRTLHKALEYCTQALREE